MYDSIPILIRICIHSSQIFTIYKLLIVNPLYRNDHPSRLRFAPLKIIVAQPQIQDQNYRSNFPLIQLEN